VAGGDLQRELADRIVGNLALMVESSPTPTQVRREIASPPSGTTLTNAYDGNVATVSNVTLTGSSGQPNDWIYVKYTQTFAAVYFTLGANVNAVASEIKGQFWNEESSGWEYIKVTADGTAVGGATLAQSGLVTFDMPKGWGLFGGEYIVRFYVTANLNDVDFAELTVRVYTETTTALATLMAYAPAGWSLDALLGYTATANGVYLTFSGESLLTAFIRVAEHTGENFTAGFGRNLIWLQDDERDSGLRAVAHVDPIAAESNPDIMLIANLRAAPDGDASDIISRVYPHGGGIGAMRATLANTTKSAPAGYTLDTTNNYLKCDATETDYGRIEYDLPCADIVARDTSDTQKQKAADALFDRALEYLQQHAEPIESYQMDVLKLARPLLPGYRVRLIYHDWVDGYHAMNVDKVLWVTETATEIDANGIRITGLQLATIDRYQASSESFSLSTSTQTTGLAAINPPQIGSTNVERGVMTYAVVEDGLITQSSKVIGVTGSWLVGFSSVPGNNDGRITVVDGVVTHVQEAT
jgi:hypothetical protein